MDSEEENLSKEIKKIWRSSKFDPNGSYIGSAIDKTEPLQDQDDL